MSLFFNFVSINALSGTDESVATSSGSPTGESINMNKAINIAAAAILGFAVNQAVFADETSATTHTTTNGSQATSNTFKATSGPAGAKVSHTKTAVQANGDGSVSATKQHESHAIDATGSTTHKKSATATTVGSDGSSATVHSSAKTTKPE